MKYLGESKVMAFTPTELLYRIKGLKNPDFSTRNT